MFLTRRPILPRFVFVILAALAILLAGCAAPGATAPLLATATPLATVAETVETAPATTIIDESSPTPASAPASTLPPTQEPPLTTPPGQPPTSEALPLPSATPLPTYPPPPTILSFTLDRSEAGPGEIVTLTWTSQGASTAEITADFYPMDSSARFSTVTPVLPNGTLPVTMPDQPMKQASFLLHIVADDGMYANASVTAHSPCPSAWFFAFPASWVSTELDTCPDSAAIPYQAAQQDFEHGRLIWLPEQPGASAGPVIYALIGDGSAPTYVAGFFYADTWQPGEMESDPSIVPPEGYYQPIRGFGKLWRNELRNALGWALAPEQAYPAQYQAADAVWSPHNGDYYAYLSTADHRVVLFHEVRLNIYWRYVP